MTKAMDNYDAGKSKGLIESLKSIKAKLLIVDSILIGYIHQNVVRRFNWLQCKIILTLPTSSLLETMDMIAFYFIQTSTQKLSKNLSHHNGCRTIKYY